MTSQTLNLGSNDIEFQKKLENFLYHISLESKYEERRLNGIRSVVLGLNVSKIRDIYYLAFLLWENIDDMIKLLNDGTLFKIFDLDHAIQLIRSKTPEYRIYDSYDLEFIDGGVTCLSTNHSIASYNCIKFIIQNTGL